MLILRRRFVLAVPLGGLALLVVLALLFVQGVRAASYPIWGLALGYGLVALVALVHVVSSTMMIRVRDGQVCWWSPLARGSHPRERSRLALTLDEGVGRGALICVELIRDDPSDELEPVELLSLGFSEAKRAQARGLAEQLDLELDERSNPVKPGDQA